MTATKLLSDNGVSSGITGYQLTGGNDGTLQLQTATSGGTATTALTIDTSQNTTLAGYLNAPNTFGFKNRIINGAMMIDQRNAGASGAASDYTVDRWRYVATQASKVTWQQNAGAATPPAGFKNYLGFTSSSAYSVLSSDTFLISQAIEGFNTADFGWGSANAQTVTLSFWVRSSLTGTFGGNINNGGGTRSYVFSYVINAANTWEQKVITIAGDTTGTWATDNTAGVVVRFGLGSGSTYSGTANAWQAGNIVQPTGSVSVVGTSGATFYITGVQLEKGSTATSFDYRPYPTELALCQRYYQTSTNVVGIANGTTTIIFSIGMQVPLRATPTVGLTGVYSASDIFAADATQSSATVGTLYGASSSALLVGTSSWSGLTSGRSYISRYNNTNVFTLSSEL